MKYPFNESEWNEAADSTLNEYQVRHITWGNSLIGTFIDGFVGNVFRSNLWRQ